jgi:hypothetical protein
MTNRDRRTQDGSHGTVQRKAAAQDAPGRATLTQMLVTGSEGATHSDAVQEVAARGVADAQAPLPHGSTIQQLFGRHDVSHVRAEVGGAGGAAATQIGASAYATGDRIAFAQSPDLHTAAHEAAHVVQQRAGVSLKGGVGQAGDAYEQHADRVADLVVAGQSAESVLDETSGRGGSRAAVQRQPAPAAAGPAPAGPGAAPPAPVARTPAQLDALKEDTVQAIAEKETHRRAIESSMQTSAGVRASYASELQATTGWTITALLQLDDTRLATFNLTRAELRSAQARAAAAGQVWTAVMATPAAMDAATWSAVPANATLLGRSGLTAADMTNMFLFRDLRTAVNAAIPADVNTRAAQILALPLSDVWQLATPNERTRVGAPQVAAMNNARRARLAPAIARRETIATLAASAPATALGIGAPTISAYRPAGGGSNFGEDSAAWQRVAAGREPPGGTGTVGQRIESAATQDSGLALGRARIGQIIDAFLAAHPSATDEEVVRDAARHHNPGNPLEDTVWGHFQTIHAARPATPAAPAAPAQGAPAQGGPAQGAPAQGAPAQAAPAPAAPGPAAPAHDAPPGATGRRSDAGGDTQQTATGGPGPSPGRYPAIAPQSEDEMLAGLTDPGDDPGDPGDGDGAAAKLA